jgi:hypothetical protein
MGRRGVEVASNPVRVPGVCGQVRFDKVWISLVVEKLPKKNRWRREEAIRLRVNIYI